MGFLINLLEAPLKLGVTIGSAISKAVGLQTQTFEQLKKQPEAKVIIPIAHVAAGTALALGGIAAVQAAIPIIAAKGGAAAVAGSVAKSLVPKTLKSGIITAAAGSIAVGAVIREPSLVGKAAKAAVQAPSELAQFGGDVASFATDPSLKSAGQIIKESPLISAALAAAGALTIGKAVIPAVTGILTKQEMEKQTGIFEQQLETMQAQTSKTGISTGMESIVGTTTNESYPQTPATMEVSSTKKRRRASKRRDQPSVRQSVRVVVSNKAVGITNRKYINERILA